jgi:hypothetical protein
MQGIPKYVIERRIVYSNKIDKRSYIYCQDLVVMWVIKTWRFWIGLWIYWTLTQLRILNYNLLYGALANLQLQSISHTVHFTTRIESSWFSVPHQSSGIGFHRPSFSFLGSLSVPVPRPQRLLACCALTVTPSSGSSCHFVRSNKYSTTWPSRLGESQMRQ